MILSRVMCAALAVGVAIAGFVLWRISGSRQSAWIHVARWLAGALAVYGCGSFLYAAMSNVPVRRVLSGAGLWHAVPYALQGVFIGGFIILPLGWIASLVRLGVSRFRQEATRPLWFQAVALTTCLALLITTLELRGLGEKRLNPQERVALLDKSLRALADGDREMPRDTWDPDYVVNRVGRDPQRLFRWVQQNTYWIPYHGVLRGPVGVLMDRQGNSLDRAILLAKLLERAGYTVRLAHGELTREQVLNLLPGLVADRQVAFTPQQPLATPNAAVQQVASRYQLDGPGVSETLRSQKEMLAQFSSELRARVTDQTDRLLKAIERPKTTDVWARTFDAAMSALADHWWVQQQTVSGWVDLDVLSDGGKAGGALTSATQTIPVKDLPAQSYHEITLRVVAEQWANGKLSEYKALEQPLRPSDLVGQPIVLQFWPTQWMADDKLSKPAPDWKTEVLAQKEWDAVVAVGGNVLATTTIPDSGDDPYTPKGGDFGGLATAFSQSMNLSSASSNKTLSAVWLEYEIRIPGEKQQTVRRTVFDLLGPAARATSSPKLALDETKRLTRSLALAMQTEILPVTCGLSREFTTHLLAQSLLGNRELFHFLVQGRLPAGIADVDELFDRSTPPVSPLYSLALARMKWGKQEEVFLDRPNLLTRHIYAVPSGKGIVMRDATDIVANGVGVSLSGKDGFAARLEQGVLDTNAESLVRMAEETFGNAGDAFKVSRAWKAIGPTQDAAAVGKLNLGEDVRRQIAADLSGGYAVVAPESAVRMRGEPFAGWWRIDRDTGDALGLGSNGWGTSATEEGSHNARTAKTAPKWLIAMKRFANVFVVVGAGYYGWCIVPLVVKHLQQFPDAAAEAAIRNPDTLNNPVATATKTVLHHSLGIWEGAVIPSVEHCVGDSIVVGGIAGVLAVVAVVGDVPTPKGQSEPMEKAPPTGGSRGCSADDSAADTPPGEEAPGGKQVTEQQGGSNPNEVEGPQPRESLQEAKDNLWAAKQALDDASTKSAQALGDVIRYRANKPSVAERTGGDPSKFDPAEFERLKEIYEQDKAVTNARYNEWVQAKQAFKEAQMAEGAARGRVGRGGLGCGWGSPKKVQPAGDEANQAPGGGANPGAGGSPGGPETGPSASPGGGGKPQGGGDPPAAGDQTPSVTDPNGPPTVRDPGAHDNGSPAIQDPYNDPAHAPTDPQFPAQHQINVDPNAGPRNPTQPSQKALVGAGSAVNALGGPK